MAFALAGIVAVLTVPVAFVALMQGSNWETGEGGSPVAGATTLAVGWLIAALIAGSHWLHVGW